MLPNPSLNRTRYGACLRRPIKSNYQELELQGRPRLSSDGGPKVNCANHSPIVIPALFRVRLVGGVVRGTADKVANLER